MKEFCLSEKIFDRDVCPVYTDEQRVIQIRDVKEFIRLLKEASENNDWEVAIDDGVEDGFRVIDGSEYIDKLAGSKLVEEKK